MIGRWRGLPADAPVDYKKKLRKELKYGCGFDDCSRINPYSLLPMKCIGFGAINGRLVTPLLPVVEA